VLGGLAVSVLLAELVCRADLAIKRRHALAGRDPARLVTTAVDGDRLYGLKPDPRHQINSDGFRDLERSAQPAPGSYRVAVIGDSVSLQPEIAFEKLWVRRLQRRFDRSLGTDRVELVNFAVTGYGTRQQLALLREVVLDASPEAVLWQFHLNDAMDPVFDGPDGGLGVYYTRPYSCLALYLDKLWTRLRRSVAVRRAGLGELPIELRVQAGEWRTMDRLLEQVRDVTRSRDLAVYVVVLPIWPAGDRWDEQAPAARSLYRRLVERFASLGFETLDLAPALERSDPAATRAAPSDLWHPSPAGHRVIADEVFRWLAPQIEREFDVEH